MLRRVFKFLTYSVTIKILTYTINMITMRIPSQLSRKAVTVRVATELSNSKSLRYGEILGFILGDGSIIGTRTDVSFINTEPICITRTLDNFLVVFNLQKTNFRYYLSIPTNQLENISLSFWQGILGSLPIRITKYYRTKKELLTVRIYNKKIKDKIKSGINKILDGTEENRQVLLGFLRGFFAAEGAIIPGKIRKEVPNSIQFPQKGTRIPIVICNILKSFQIEGRVVIKQKKADYYCVNITGFENYERLFQLNICSLHPEKDKKIKLGLNSYKMRSTRKLVLPKKLLNALSRRPMTRTEINNFLKPFVKSTNSMLYQKKGYLVKNKLINRETTTSGIILWKVTENGLEFLRNNMG